jgi:hypothetical protein
MSIEIARTILDQLGGNKFIAMTGAKHFTAGFNTLSFQLPGNFALKRITGVRIVLTDADLYDMTFMKRFKGDIKVVEEVEGLYFDQLQDVFKSVTGLDTHL